MPNTLVNFYREQFPNDTKSDEEIMESYATSYPQEDLNQFPDFVSEWGKIQKQRDIDASGFKEEASKAFKQGIPGMIAPVYGGLAFLSRLTGAKGAEEFYLEHFKEKQAEMQEPSLQPTVPRYEDIDTSSLGGFLQTGLQYAGGKIGGALPAVGEAGAFALAGTLVAPGEGTVTGAGAGLLARGAARVALNKIVTRGISAEVRKEIEEYAAGKVIEGGLSKAASNVLKESAGVLASVGNFGAIGTGQTFGQLATTPGVPEDKATEGALIAGLGSSIGAVIPARVLKGIFGEEVSRSWIDKFARQVPQELLTGAGGMGTMEFFNILAEKYADPKKRDEPFTKEDQSRMINAAIVGAGLAVPAAGISVAKGVKPPEEPAKPAAPTPAEEPAPAMTPAEVATAYPTAVSLEMEQRLRDMAESELALGSLSASGQRFLDSLPEPVQARYQAIKDAMVATAEKVGKVEARMRQIATSEAVTGSMSQDARDFLDKLRPQQKARYEEIKKEEVANAAQRRKEQESLIREHPGAVPQLSKEEEDRLKQAGVQGKGAEADTGDSTTKATGVIAPAQSTFNQAVAELTPEQKEALRQLGIPQQHVITPPSGFAKERRVLSEAGKPLTAEAGEDLTARAARVKAQAEEAQRTERAARLAQGLPTPTHPKELPALTQQLEKETLQRGRPQIASDLGTPVPGAKKYTGTPEVGRAYEYGIRQTVLSHPHGAAVENKGEAFYSDPGTTLFLSDDGLAGVAVSPGGDLVSVFRHPYSTADINLLLTEASKAASTLDGFDVNGFLPNKYGKFGFRPVARVAFDRNFAPPGWDYAKDGEPDVVLMVRDPEGKSGAPEVKDNYAAVKKKVPVVSYEEAKKLQQEAKAKVAAAKEAETAAAKAKAEAEAAAKAAKEAAAKAKAEKEAAEKARLEKEAKDKAEAAAKAKAEADAKAKAEKEAAEKAAAEAKAKKEAEEKAAAAKKQTPEEILTDLGWSKEDIANLDPDDVIDAALEKRPPPTPEPTEPTELTPFPPGSKQADLLDRISESINAWLPIKGLKKSEIHLMYSGIGRDEDDPGIKTRTKGLGVFKTPDGKIMVASVYKNPGETVYLPNGGSSWKKVLAAGYEPIETIRTTKAQEKFNQEYTAEEWDEVRKHLLEKASGARDIGVETSEQEAGTSTTATGGETPEKISVGERKKVEKRSIGQKIESDKGRGITADLAGRIHEAAIFYLRSEKGKAEKTPREAIIDATTANGKLLKEIADAAGPDAAIRVLHEVWDRYEEAAEKFRASGSTDPAKFRSEVIRALQSIVAKASESRGEADEGYSDDLRHLSPSEGSRALGSDEMAAIGKQLLQQLDRAGIPVDLVKAQAGALVDEAAKVLGSYNRALKSIFLALSDVSRPNSIDLRVMMEEITHALFDRESKEIQEPILRAFSQLDKIRPEEFEAVKRDIANAYGVKREDLEKTIPKNIYNEELMAGWMTRKLQAEGFNPVQSRGIAQAVLRMLKDLYLRSAMWVQKNLLGREYANADLSLRYFQNRLEAFMSGDKEFLSWTKTLGGPKPLPINRVSWHPAIEGAGNTLERYDSNLDRIEYSPLVNDSRAAMRFNIDQALRFSSPAPAPAPTTTGPTLSPTSQVDASVRLNIEAARNNRVEEVATRAAADAGIAAGVLRDTFGLTDTVAYRQEIQKQADKLQAQGGAPTFDPTKTPEAFGHEHNLFESTRKARQDIVRDQSKIQQEKVFMDDRGREKTKERDEILKKNSELFLTFPDAEAMTKQMVKDLAKEPTRIVNEIQGESKRLGVVNQQLRDIEKLEDRPIPKSYSRVFQKLFTGDQLKGAKLFDMLDMMANDPGIDFSRSASQIRQHMQDVINAGNVNHTYEILTQSNPESKALLATVIAYAKQNDTMMALLEARKMKVGAERVALIQALKDLHKLDTKDLAKGIRQLSKTVANTERAKVAFKRELRRVTRLNKDIQRAKNVSEMAKKALPAYAHALDVIATKFEMGDPFEAHSGAVMKIPQTPTSGREDWDDFTFSLSETTKDVKAITDPQQLEQALTKQAAYLKHQQNLFQQGNLAALGSDYQTIRRQFSEVFNSRFYEPYQQATAHHLAELALQPVSKQFDSFGTPAARSAGARTRAYVSDFNAMRQTGLTQGNKVVARMNDALGQFNKTGAKASMEWFKREVLQPSMAFIEQQNDLGEMGLKPEEVTDRLYDRLGRYLDSDERIRKAVGTNFGPFMEALRTMLELNYEEGQRYAGIVDRVVPGTGIAEGVEMVGPGVEDIRMGGRIRKRFAAGLRTGQHRFSDYFKVLIHGLRESGWSEGMARDEFKLISNLWYNGDEAAIDAIEAKFFHNANHGDVIMDRFVRALAHAPGDSSFDGPLLADGVTRPPALPEVVRDAFDNSGGSVRKFAELMYDGHDGEGGKGQYVQEVYERLADIFAQYDSGFKRTEGEGYESNSLKGIVQPAFLDARRFTNAPAQWFDYNIYDRRQQLLMMQKIAAQKNFGRDGEKLEADVKAVEREIEEGIKKFRDANDQAKRAIPSGNWRQVRAEAVKILGSREEYDRLKKLVGKQNIPAKARRGLNAFFHQQNQEDISLAWPVQMAQTIASLDVNQLITMITRFSTILDGFLHFGLSPASLKFTFQTAVGTAKELSGSLLQGIWFDSWRNSVGEDEYARIIGPDPLSSRRMKDIMVPLEGERGWFSKAMRRLRDIQEVGLNLQGENARRTVFRLFAPVSMSFTAINKAGTIAMWNLAKKFIALGQEHLDRGGNPDEISAKDLGLGRFNGHSFEIFKKDLQTYGLKYEEMVKAASERKKTGGPVMTDNEQARLCSLWDQEISIESSIATMPLAAYNSKILRFAVPLLGWPYRRALQINEISKDVKGQHSLQALGYGLLGLSAVAMGGVGVTLLQDAYSEHLLGKKRNLRSLRLPTTGEDWVAINERLTRIGTMGFWGELLNSAVNVGTGEGDNRILSVDGRVVALGTLNGVMQMISSVRAENYDPDYMHVVRPFISAIGGGGALQYMDLINHAGPFDNVESRFIKRLSADNYLRVVGRDLGMSLKKGGGGGYATPTPMTPWISRMEMAVYGNDPLAFREAYRGALAEAKRAGKPDPANYVKRDFEGRHPLRYVFASTPSHREYRQILNELDQGGQESVRDAVRLFNHYGSSIGLAPFEGSVKKDQQEAANPNSLSRARLISSGLFR